MSEPFSFATSFKLDRAHLEECFTESVSSKRSIKNYYKALLLAVIGACLLLFTEIDAYAGWFFLGLGVVEALSVRFQKSWWIWRQMLSKSYKSEVNLTIDDEAISANSFYVNFTIPWSTVTKLQATERGWLVFHQNGKNYISNSCLPEQARAYLESVPGTEVPG